MKINVKLWVSIIFLSTLIIAVQYFESARSREFTFSRSFKDEVAFKEVKENFNAEISDYFNLLLNKNHVAAYNLVSSDSVGKAFSLHYYDINSAAKIGSSSIQIPLTANIAASTRSHIYYIDRFQLYSYDVAKHDHQVIDVPGLKVTDVVALEGYENKLLCFGELKTEKEFMTGFFLIHKGITNVGEAVHTVETNSESKVAENAMRYAGSFQVSDDSFVSYVCDKYSKLYFFNDNGAFSKEINTKDQAPLPTLVFDKDFFFYKRGETFTTNTGMVKDHDKVLVFSSRTDNTKHMTVDLYDFGSGEYLSSYEFPLSGKVCADINYFSVSNKRVFIGLDERIAVLDYQLN